MLAEFAHLFNHLLSELHPTFPSRVAVTYASAAAMAASSLAPYPTSVSVTHAAVCASETGTCSAPHLLNVMRNCTRDKRQHSCGDPSEVPGLVGRTDSGAATTPHALLGELRTQIIVGEISEADVAMLGSGHQGELRENNFDYRTGQSD